MMKTKYYIPSLHLLGLLLLVASGCQDVMEKIVKAPDPYIENIVQGHEQIYSIKAILRLAVRNEDPDYDVSFEPYYFTALDLDDTEETAFPVYQEIEIRKNDQGSMEIVSEREAFDVVKSEHLYYALELKYFDINAKLINHQFSRWFRNEGGNNKDGGMDDPNSTLLVHQHFFTIANYSLDKRFGVYPMTLDKVDLTRDSLFVDDYTFDLSVDKQIIPADYISSGNVYVPSGYTPGSNTIRYDAKLAYEAELRKNTAAASETVDHEGQTYVPARGILTFDMNKKVPELFTYEYRDTDPVESYLGDELDDQDDLGRIRTGNIVGLLRFRRTIGDAAEMYKQDHLGFKGVMQFKQAHLQYQVNVRCAHITTVDDNNRQNDRFPFGKYRKGDGFGIMAFEPYGYNEIKPAWDSYDINFPLPFRVIADADGDEETFVQDVKALDEYKEVPAEELQRIFYSGGRYFTRHTSVYF